MTHYKQRQGHKIMKKIHGNWVAVLATAIMLGGTVTQSVVLAADSAEEYLQLPQMPSKFEGKDDFLKETLIKEEIDKAKKVASQPWKKRTTKEVKEEIERQQKLELPVYIVQWGDTLEVIAEVTQRPIEELLKENELKPKHALVTGDLLKGVRLPDEMSNAASCPTTMTTVQHTVVTASTAHTPTETVQSQAPTAVLPSKEMPVSVVEETHEIPSNYPTMELPVSEVGYAPEDYPTVELPSAIVPDDPEAPVEVYHIPSEYPVVELPEFEIEYVPSDYPTVELPASEIEYVPNEYPTVELPEAEMPAEEVSYVPKTYPTVELPVSEIEYVPSDYPTVELPESEVAYVPNTYPTVELPEAEVPQLPSVQPKEPTQPGQPNEPFKPVQPTDPEKPSEPTKPVQPTDPEKPSEPTKPVQPTDPEKPSEPTKPTQPTNPEKPSEPTKPTQPTNNLQLKAYELKGIQTATLVKPDVLKVTSSTHRDTLLTVKNVENTTFNGRQVKKVVVEHPDLVQYNAQTNQYDSQLVFYIDQEGRVVNAADSQVDYVAHPTARSNYATAYRNVEKLMPYDNRDVIVHKANTLPTTHALFTKQVAGVVPLANEQLVSDVKQHRAAINKILVHYTDGTTEQFNVTLQGDTPQFATYKIEGTDLTYSATYTDETLTSAVDQVLSEFVAMDYYTEEMFNAFNLEFGIGSKEISEYRDKNPGMSEAEAKRAVMREKLESLKLSESFNEVKTSLREKLNWIVQHSYADLTQRQATHAGYVVEELRKNKAQILASLTYLNRLYNVSVGTVNLEEWLLAHKEFYGKPVNTIDWLKTFKSLEDHDYLLHKNPGTYSKVIAPVTKKASVIDFLSDMRQKFVPNKTDNEWFKSAIRTPIIVEKATRENSTAIPSDAHHVFKHLKSEHLMNLALPLLRTTADNYFLISTMTTLEMGIFDKYFDSNLKQTNPSEYNRKVEDLRKRIENAATLHAGHFDTWYRIASPNVKQNLITDTLVMDGYKLPKGDWLPGDSSMPLIKEVMKPLFLWYDHNRGLNAAANKGYGVTFYHASLLDGHATFAHEMVHILDNKVHLSGYGLRNGQGMEAYATGMFQPPTNREAYVGLNLIHEDGDKQTFHNSSPSRFQSMRDVDNYVKHLFDLLYVLDYVEAKAIVKNPTAKTHMLRKVEAVKDDHLDYFSNTTGHTIDRVRPYTKQEMDGLNWNKWSDLIMNDAMVVRRPDQKQWQTGRDDYNVSPFFSPIYAALENDKGSSGNITFKRTAYELWADQGYDKGYIPYASNKLNGEAQAAGQPLSDSYVLTSIYKGQYPSYKEFKKAMFEKRISQLPKLKSIDSGGKVVDFAFIEQLMDEAVRHDAESLSKGQPAQAVVKLKEWIYREYHKMTDQFRTSIFNGQ